MNKKKITNPLYVVSTKDNVVEEAQNYADLLIKKLGLTPFLELMDSLWQFFVSQLQMWSRNYKFLEIAQEFLEAILSRASLFMRYQI